MVDLKRRRLFSRAAQQAPLRPPWAQQEALFIEHCTRCGDCAAACETHIIKAGSGGFPELDFQQGECTFCQNCVSVCPTGALSLATETPFQSQIAISESCLALKGVMCRSCEDQCDAEAIRFTLQVGGVARPEINTDACTFCGACVAPCPTQAIAIHSHSK